MEVRLAHNQEVVGSNPIPASNEVIAMRGSSIAKQIIKEQQYEAKIKAKLLREVYRKRRGESNHDNSNTIDNITNG